MPQRRHRLPPNEPPPRGQRAREEPVDRRFPRSYDEVQGYYGSGGSYGYGGGFEHADVRRSPWDDPYDYAREGPPPRGRYRGLGPSEPYEQYGGFGSAAGDFQRRPRPLGDRPPSAVVPPERGRFYGKAPQGYTRSDARIREDICDQLMFGHVDPSGISVSVEDGQVTLEGQVDTRYDKYLVEELSVHVLGVKDVENRLRLRRTGTEPAAPRPKTRSTPPHN